MARFCITVERGPFLTTLTRNGSLKYNRHSNNSYRGVPCYCTKYQVDHFSTLALCRGMYSCHYLCSRSLACLTQLVHKTLFDMTLYYSERERNEVVKTLSQCFIHTYHTYIHTYIHSTPCNTSLIASITAHITGVSCGAGTYLRNVV